MAAIQTLEEKLETAADEVFQALEGLPAGLEFHRAFDADEIGELSVLIAAQDNGVPPDEEAIEPTGNRLIMLGVSVKAPSDFGRAAHNELAGMIKDVVMADDFAASLTAAEVGLTVQYARAVDVVRNADGQHFLSVITVECWCSPSDFEEEEI